MSGFCKYYKQKKQVSYDNGITWQDVVPAEYQQGQFYEMNSPDCGYQYLEKWVVVSGYICYGITKYKKEQKYISYNGGINWTATQEFRRGSVIEEYSSDCGYMPGDYKIIATMCETGEVRYAPCNETSVASMYDFTYPFNNVSSLVFGTCVTKIADYCIREVECLTSVSFPNTLLEIGVEAFYRCSSLPSVDIPSSTKKIDERAFMECTNLTSVDLKDGLEEIEAQAFQGCTSLPSIVIPSGITTIEDDTFWDCSSLTSVTLSNTVNKIGHSWSCTGTSRETIGTGMSFDSSPFGFCISLPNIVIPNSVRGIGTEAFLGCSSLTSVTLSSNLEWLDNWAFSGCTSLKTITLPSSLECLGYGIFAHCSSLSSATINNSVIGDYQFSACTGLQSVNLPNTMERIGENAFNGCSSLQSITIPSGITTVNVRTFKGCTDLKTVNFPDTLTNIGDYSFQNCSSLSGISSPYVKRVGQYAFDGCSGLTSFNFFNCEYFDGDCFKGCKSLTNAELPGIKNKVYSGTFSGCTSLQSVSIGRGVTGIFSGAFAGCTALTGVTVSATTPPELSWSDDHYFGNPNCKVYVPCDSYNSYKVANNWSTLYNNGLLKAIEPNCEPAADEVRWVNSGTTCYGVDKYYLQVKQLSFDSGATWVTTSDTRRGDLIESQSEDCGYSPDYNTTYLTVKASQSGNGITISSFQNGSNQTISGSTDGGTTWENKTYFTLTPGEAIKLKAVGEGRRLGIVGECEVYGNIMSLISGDSFTNANSIPERAFYDTFSGCTGITSVKNLKLPVTTLSRGCYEELFYNCSGITESPILPATTLVSDCYRYMFYGCSSLTAITCSATTLDYSASTSTHDYYPTYYWVYGVNTVNGVFNKHSAANFWTNGVSGIPISWNYPFTGKVKMSYSGGSTTEYPCDSTSSVTSGNITTTNAIQAELGNCAKTIGDNCFSGCSSLSSVTIANSMITIGEGAFKDCSGLTTITVPNSVTSIGIAAFKHCNKLTSINIPTGITNIAASTYFGCSGLTSITIPSGVTSIGGSAFQDCKRIASVNIPDTVTSIGYQAFNGCSLLSAVTIPYGVTNIGRYAFSHCTGFNSITVNATTPPTLELENGHANSFNDTNNCPIYVPCDSVSSYKAASGWSNYADRIQCQPKKFTATYSGGTTYTAECDSSTELTTATTKPSGYDYSAMATAVIGDCVTSIGDYAFYNCSGLTSCTIGSGVTTIGASVFYGCGSLTSIDIPSGVTSIGQYAFNGCKSLTSITIPNSVTSIGSSAFYNCSGLTSCTIGSGVTTIGSFAFRGCTGLTSITVNAITPPTLRSGAFVSTNDCPIYVPASAVNAYKAATNWSDYASRIQSIPT